MANKIIVTGGAGYIGSFMVRSLRGAGLEPVIVDNFSSGHREAVKDFEVRELDIVKDPAGLTKIFQEVSPIGVIHMASFIQMGESFVNPSKYFKNNLQGALNVLDAMVASNTKYFVLSSSAGVYGNPKSVPIMEDSEKNPENPYGETKLMIERFLHWYEKAHNLRYVSIRYFNAAGAALDGSLGENHPEESHIIPIFISKALQGEVATIFGDDYKTPDGTCIRDYIHVLDLTEAHTKAIKYLEEGGASECFNCGIGKGYSNKEIVEMIKKVSGIDFQVKIGERRKGDADELVASVEKIKNALGWEAKYTLEEIVASAFLWHKSNPNGFTK